MFDLPQTVLNVNNKQKLTSSKVQDIVQTRQHLLQILTCVSLEGSIYQREDLSPHLLTDSLCAKGERIDNLKCVIIPKHVSLESRHTDPVDLFQELQRVQEARQAPALQAIQQTNQVKRQE